MKKKIQQVLVGMVLALISLQCQKTSRNGKEDWLTIAALLFTKNMTFTYVGAQSLQKGEVTAPGDGPTDNYPDHLATPTSVALQVCGFGLIKSPEAGGPPAAREAFSVSDMDRYFPLGPIDKSLAFDFPESDPCKFSQTLVLGKDQPEINVPLNGVTFGPEHDRIVLIVKEVIYHFGENVSGNRAFIWLRSLEPAASSTNSVGGQFRVSVLGADWQSCPQQGLIGANFDHNSKPRFPDACGPTHEFMLLSDGQVYDGYETPAPDGVGNYYTMPDGVEFGMTWPEYAGPAVYPYGVHILFGMNGKDHLLTTEAPAVSMAVPGHSIVVTQIVRKIVPDMNTVAFKIDVVDSLFWDSSSANSYFDPDSDPGDQGNADSNNENLTDPLKRNLIFRGPRFRE